MCQRLCGGIAGGAGATVLLEPAGSSPTSVKCFCEDRCEQVKWGCKVAHTFVEAPPPFVASCGETTEGGVPFADAACAGTRVYDSTTAAVSSPNDAHCCKTRVEAPPPFVASCGETTEGGVPFADAACAGTRVYDSTTAAVSSPNDAHCCKTRVDAPIMTRTACGGANVGYCNSRTDMCCRDYFSGGLVWNYHCVPSCCAAGPAVPPMAGWPACETYAAAGTDLSTLPKLTAFGSTTCAGLCGAVEADVTVLLEPAGPVPKTAKCFCDRTACATVKWGCTVTSIAAAPPVVAVPPTTKPPTTTGSTTGTTTGMTTGTTTVVGGGGGGTGGGGPGSADDPSLSVWPGPGLAPESESWVVVGGRRRGVGVGW